MKAVNEQKILGKEISEASPLSGFQRKLGCLVRDIRAYISLFVLSSPYFHYTLPFSSLSIYFISQLGTINFKMFCKWHIRTTSTNLGLSKQITIACTTQRKITATEGQWFDWFLTNRHHFCCRNGSKLSSLNVIIC